MSAATLAPPAAPGALCRCGHVRRIHGTTRTPGHGPCRACECDAFKTGPGVAL